MITLECSWKAIRGLVIAAALGLGCLAQRSPGADLALADASAKGRMESARDQIANVRSNIFLTLVAMDAARRESGPDKPQFQAFENQLATTERLAKEFGARAAEMKEKGQAYFADWEEKAAAIQDPGLRDNVEKRYTERKRCYDAINRCMQEARQNFFSYYDDTKQMKALLEAGRGQEVAARDVFMDANWRSIDTQRALICMEQEFDNLAKSFEKEPK